jgi:signal peptidase I
MTQGTATHWQTWERNVQKETERFLTWRLRRRNARKAKQKKRNPVVDWLDAILSAVVIVLLINQYLLQAYQIPSPSMEPGLLVNDRIFVNKMVFGPELIPGMVKLPGFAQPSRGNVVIFESPEYLSSGPVMDVLQRIVYMVTLSLVDIDKDENGQPKKHFLIKRSIGMPGDRVRMNEGNVEVLTPGEKTWISEADLKSALGMVYSNVRMYKPEQYPTFKNAGIGRVLQENRLPASATQKAAALEYFRVDTDASGNPRFAIRQYDDEKYRTLWEDATSWAIEPFNFAKAAEWRLLKEGYYVPEHSIFPMGDNRDNSHDARWFGPVRLEKVLGKGLFRYWPLPRFGAVR